MMMAAKGRKPKKLRPATAETRPRSSAGERSWTMVLARPTSVETPTARQTSEAPAQISSCDWLRLTSAPQARTMPMRMAMRRMAGFKAMMRSEPETDPAPEHSISKPICSGVAWRSFFAYNGSKTMMTGKTKSVLVARSATIARLGLS